MQKALILRASLRVARHTLKHKYLVASSVKDIYINMNQLSCLLQTSESNSHCLNALCQLNKLQCVDLGVVVNQLDDWQVLDPTLKEPLPSNIAVMPVAPQLCGEFLEDLKAKKDSNGNTLLSLSQVNSVLHKALPSGDVRVYCIPLLSAQQLYFKANDAFSSRGDCTPTQL